MSKSMQLRGKDKTGYKYVVQTKSKISQNQ